MRPLERVSLEMVYFHRLPHPNSARRGVGISKLPPITARGWKMSTSSFLLFTKFAQTPSEFKTLQTPSTPEQPEKHLRDMFNGVREVKMFAISREWGRGRWKVSLKRVVFKQMHNSALASGEFSPSGKSHSGHRALTITSERPIIEYSSNYARI